MIKMEAARIGDISRMKSVVRSSHDINAQANDGYTALHCTAKADQVEMIRYSLRKGGATKSLESNIGDRDRSWRKSFDRRITAGDRSMRQS